MNTGNTKPHCDFLSSNSWRGVTWLTFDFAHREKKRDVWAPVLLGRVFRIIKVEKRKSKQTQRKTKVVFNRILWGKQISIWPFREDQPRSNSWKENYISETICMTTNGLKKDNSSILRCFVVLLALKANAKNTDQQNSLSDIEYWNM